MKDFWEAHKHKIWGALLGILATLLVVCSGALCSKLPPVFAQVCVMTVKQAADMAKVEAAKQDEAPVIKAADLSLPVCDEAHCLSTGYALPLTDGGSCRCAVKP